MPNERVRSEPPELLGHPVDAVLGLGPTDSNGGRSHPVTLVDLDGALMVAATTTAAAAR